MPGIWSPLTNQPASHTPPFNANHMMLLTDGTVLVQDVATANWYLLTPNSSGSYVDGTWSTLATGPNGPTYYASAVLRDGRVFMAGGEDNFGNNGIDIADCEIYDPVADSWESIPGPGWPKIGDAPCCMLPDGTILLGNINDTRTAIYDPVAGTWSNGPNKHDASSEETWTLLPDQTVLVAECSNHPAAEKYVAAAGTWVNAGSVPAGFDLVQSSIGSSNEIGPAILMPDGRLFAIGASGHTALYTMPAIANQPGTWAAGPDFPSDANGIFRAFDAPAVLLPNGKVLCVAGPNQADGWSGSPSHCYEFDGTSLVATADPPNAAGSETWTTRMLLLPNGEVLLSARSSNIQVYQPTDGSPDPAWAPQITNCPATVVPGNTYTLEGRQLNGLSQANSYGDDATMATNFPLVRITNLATGHVFYCRTHDHSTMGVATGSVIHSTQFDVPAGTELGASQLCVIANGIAACIPVMVHHHIKIWKELKWEIKENFKVEIDVFKSILSDIPKLKDNEGDPWRQFQGDPAWLKAVQLIAEQTERLQREVSELRSFILPEERPQLGEDALKRAAAQPAKQATPKAKPPAGKPKKKG